MAFKMRGNPYKMGTHKTKKTMAYMKSPLEQQKEESREDKYARIIKEYNMIKDGGRWIDPKTGRTPANIVDGVKREQRRFKVDVDGNLMEE